MTKEQVQERLIRIERRLLQRPEQTGLISLRKAYTEQLRWGFLKKRRKT